VIDAWVDFFELEQLLRAWGRVEAGDAETEPAAAASKNGQKLHNLILLRLVDLGRPAAEAKRV